MTGRSAASAASGHSPKGGAAKASPAKPSVPNAAHIAVRNIIRDAVREGGGMMIDQFADDYAAQVFAAMREPTDEMIDAAAATAGMKAASSAMVLHQARGYGFEVGAFDAGSPLHQAWRAMIDAASAIKGSAQDAQRLDPKGESAAPEGGDAQQ